MRYLKHVPNALSVSRIVAAVLLLFTAPLEGAFYPLYIWCGVSDAADGLIARRFHLATPAGAALDSAADLIFTAVLLVLFVPMLRLSLPALLAIGLILLVRCATLVLGYLKFKAFAPLHTVLNKLTGLLLFLFPLLFYVAGQGAAVAAVCVAAGVSAAEELAIQIKSPVLARDVRSIVDLLKKGK